MKTIPIDIFLSFKNKCKKELLLFDEVIKDNYQLNLKQLNLKNGNNLSLILNKITLQNYPEKVKIFLQEEFLGNNNLLNKFTREIFVKMLQDINFQFCYLKFYTEIISAYNFYGIEYDFSYLINLVESKYLMDIHHKDVLLSKIIKENLSDDKSLVYHNLILISDLVKEKILDDKILDVIFNDLNQHLNLAEELYIFVKENPKPEFLQQIDLSKYNLRYQVLFSELNQINKQNSIKLEKEQELIVNNKEENEIRNMIEEYLFLEEIEEILTYFKNKISTHQMKNLWVEVSLDLYLEEEENKILYLLMNLYKKKLINKSNINVGLNDLMKRNELNQENVMIKNIIKFLNKHEINLPLNVSS